MGKANPFHFSTKYQDDETDLLYCGYRYYSAGAGRWISRDSLSETGGFNLYGLAANHPVLGIDPLGQMAIFSGAPRWGACGGIVDNFSIYLGSTFPRVNGYIVQHVKVDYTAQTCSGTVLHDSFDYYEAMPVSAAPNAPWEADDSWAYSSSPGTHGSIKWKRELRFYPTSLTGDLGGVSRPSPSPVAPEWPVGVVYGGSDTPALPWGSDGAEPPYPIGTGEYPSTGQTPWFWSYPPPDSVTHYLDVHWSCCCPEDFTYYNNY